MGCAGAALEVGGPRTWAMRATCGAGEELLDNMIISLSHILSVRNRSGLYRASDINRSAA
jgi:hypothetical protein